MKNYLQLFLMACLATAGGVQASSISIINPTITFTLTDIQVGGQSAVEFGDYEGDSQVDVGSGFIEYFEFGGTLGIGSTSGSGSFSQNGGVLDPNIGGGFLEVGDTLTIALNSQATANTGLVARDQLGGATFGYLNFTDDGFGNTDTLSFLFDYSLSYTTSLTNDVAGDQAFVRFETTVGLTDDDSGITTTLDLFPESAPGQISELSNAAGTIMPGGTTSGSFSLDLAGSIGYFDIDANARTSSFVNAVPVPAAVWLFGSGLIGLVGLARRKTV